MVDISLFEEGVLQSEFDLALQELDILFNTENTQLIGVPNYGMNFEQFLWSLTPSVDSIEKYIKNKITTCTFYLSKMQYDIDASYLYGDGECVYVIKFTLYWNEKTVNKNFVVKHNT